MMGSKPGYPLKPFLLYKKSIFLLLGTRLKWSQLFCVKFLSNKTIFQTFRSVDFRFFAQKSDGVRHSYCISIYYLATVMSIFIRTVQTD